MVLDFFFKERRLIQYDKHIFTIYMYHFLQFIYMYIHVKNWHLGNLHTYTLILWLEYIPTYTEIFKKLCVYFIHKLSHWNFIHTGMSFEMVVYYLFWIICIFLKYFQNLLLNCLNYKLYDTNTKFFRNWRIKVFFLLNCWILFNIFQSAFF